MKKKAKNTHINPTHPQQEREVIRKTEKFEPPKNHTGEIIAGITGAAAATSIFINCCHTPKTKIPNRKNIFIIDKEYNQKTFHAFKDQIYAEFDAAVLNLFMQMGITVHSEQAAIQRINKHLQQNRDFIEDINCMITQPHDLALQACDEFFREIKMELEAIQEQNAQTEHCERKKKLSASEKHEQSAQQLLAEQSSTNRAQTLKTLQDNIPKLGIKNGVISVLSDTQTITQKTKVHFFC